MFDEQIKYLREKYPIIYPKNLSLDYRRSSYLFYNEEFLQCVKPDCQDDKILITQLLMELEHVI